MSTPHPTQRSSQFKETLAFFVVWAREVIVEPILLALAIVLLFSRLQPIIEASGSIGAFFDVVKDDMNSHVGIYGLIVILYLAWVIMKSYKFKVERASRQEERRDRQQASGDLNKRLGDISNSIEQLATELRKDREERNARESRASPPSV